jgi:threonine aldolase
MLGGALRQVGILAAAGDYALEHNLERLAEDHANARELARLLIESGGVRLDLASIETNIIVFDLAPGAPDAATVVQAAQARGVLVYAFGPRRIRAVTHLDLTAEQCRRAGGILAALAAGRGL